MISDEYVSYLIPLSVSVLFVKHEVVSLFVIQKLIMSSERIEAQSLSCISFILAQNSILSVLVPLSVTLSSKVSELYKQEPNLKQLSDRLEYSLSKHDESAKKNLYHLKFPLLLVILTC